MADSSYVVDKRKNKHKKPNYDFFGNIVKKIKKVKHLDIVIAVAVVGLTLVFALSVFGGSESITKTNDVDYLTLEDRVCEVLSQIKGAGNVKVMINFSDSGEIITATTNNSSIDKTTDTSTSGNRTTESKTDNVSPVIIQQDGKDTPLIVKELAPDVLGVVVVAEGADNVSVRINLLQAVQTLLNVDSNKIEIFTMK